MWQMSIENFLHDLYQRHNKRRQEHLATLGLPIAGRSVLELGAGVGDHTSFFLDRYCQVTVTDARPDNVEYMRKRYPDVEARLVDIEAPTLPDLSQHDVVYAYGLLYHLGNPELALARMAELTKDLLLLETCVSFGEHEFVGMVDENADDPTQAAHGRGCRPSRLWVFNALRRHFAHAYTTTTQPWHPEFPLDWRGPPPANATGLFRAVFVASRRALKNARLLEDLPDVQTRE
jgi:trans-aconitate methyltransferase